MGGEAPAVVRQKSVKEDVKKALLTDLVGVYTRDVYVLVIPPVLCVYLLTLYRTFGAERATRLLESQGVNLDVVDVCPSSSLFDSVF